MNRNTNTGQKKTMLDVDSMGLTEQSTGVQKSRNPKSSRVRMKCNNVEYLCDTEGAHAAGKVSMIQQCIANTREYESQQYVVCICGTGTNKPKNI